MGAGRIVCYGSSSGSVCNAMRLFFISGRAHTFSFAVVPCGRLLERFS